MVYVYIIITSNNLTFTDFTKYNTELVNWQLVLYTLHLASDWTGNWAGRTCPTVLGSLAWHYSIKYTFFLTRPLIKTCMPGLKVNLHNTRTNVVYSRFQKKSVNFSKSFFPFFSKLRSTLSKELKSQKDIVIFKENLKSIYNPKGYKHFKYGSRLGNKYLSHLRLGRSFLYSHRFVTGLADSDRCLKCNKIQHWRQLSLRVDLWKLYITKKCTF